MKRIGFLLLIGIFSIMFISCQKNEVELMSTEDLIEQEAEIEILLSDIDAFSEEIIDDQLNFFKSATISVPDEDDSCPVITYYRNSEPRKMIIDFGNECLGKDGRTRSGKIIIASTSFENMTATRTKTFENFSVDGRSIEGEIIRTITLVSENHSRIAEVKEDLTITMENKIAIRTSSMTRTHEPGRIFDRSDDLISSWGEVVTKWQDGSTFSKTIAEENPLVFKSICRQIVSGIVSITRGEKSWSIDYGQGECDNKAIITHDGESKEIRIGRGKY